MSTALQQAKSFSVTTDDGVKLACRSMGDGAETVLFVHGWMNSSHGFDPVLSSLDTKGLRVVTFDLRGSGDSGKPDDVGVYTIERFAKDVVAVADHLKADKFSLVAFSMGGPISQWIAATWPDRVKSMALICPSPASGVPLPQDVIDMFRNCAGKRDVQTQIYQAGGTKSPTAAMLDDASGIPAPALQGGFDAFTKANFIEKLSAIKAPSLVITTDDSFYSKDLQQGVNISETKGSRLLYIPGAGHWIIAELPEKVSGALHDFFHEQGLR